MAPKAIKLALRHDADKHPDLCRIDGCPGKIDTRGVCRACRELATREGTYESFALPSRRGGTGVKRIEHGGALKEVPTATQSWALVGAVGVVDGLRHQLATVTAERDDAKGERDECIEVLHELRASYDRLHGANRALAADFKASQENLAAANLVTHVVLRDLAAIALAAGVSLDEPPEAVRLICAKIHRSGNIAITREDLITRIEAWEMADELAASASEIDMGDAPLVFKGRELELSPKGRRGLADLLDARATELRAMALSGVG